METKTISIEIPADNSLENAINNIHVALNKANKAGLFDMRESYQLFTDITLITKIFTQKN